MKRPRRTRAQKAAENRSNLMRAAAEVVGEYGYAEASVSRIVERAGLAQGTFYLYFESRQDLFDKLLPEVGAGALSFIRDRIGDVPDFMTMEEKGMHAFFEYVVENPAYLRIFTEAEIAAPVAYEKYTADRFGRFLDRLTAAWRTGEVNGYAQRELAVLTQIMLASRTYLYHHYAKTPKGVRPVPRWVIDAYIKFVRRGIGAAKAAGEKPAAKSKARLPAKAQASRRSPTRKPVAARRAESRAAAG